MGRIWGAVVALVLVAGLLIVPGSAEASGVILQSKYGPTHLSNPGPHWSGSMIADVENASLDNRARVHLWDIGEGGSSNQVWYGYTLQGYPSDQIVFINAKSGKCLDKSMDNGNNNGAVVFQYTCTYATNQRWQVVPYTATSGFHTTHIVSVESGQCLDVKDKVYARATPLQVWSCNNSGWNQAWYLYAA